MKAYYIKQLLTNLLINKKYIGDIIFTSSLLIALISILKKSNKSRKSSKTNKTNNSINSFKKHTINIKKNVLDLLSDETDAQNTNIVTQSVQDIRLDDKINNKDDIYFLILNNLEG